MTNNTICALDIGEYYTKLVIGSYVNDKVEVLFSKKLLSKGIINGDVVNKGEVLSTITALREEAEKFGHIVNEVVLVLPNKTLNVYHKVGHVNQPQKRIAKSTLNDIKRLKESCMSNKINNNDVVVGMQDILYSIDGRPFDRKPPIDFQYNSIALEAYIYTMKESITNGIGDVLDACNIRIKNIIINSVAVANYILTEEQKRRGTFVVDIGVNSHNVSFFKDGLFTEFKEGKCGGNYLTNQIAMGLEIDNEEAEIVKTRYASCDLNKATNIDLFRSNNGHVINERQIVEKTCIGVTNLANDIKHTIDLMLVKNDPSYTIAIVGGTSSLPYLDKYLEEEFEQHVVIRNRNDFGARNKVYYACVGAIKHFSKHN